MTTNALFGELLIQGIKRIGLNVGIISQVNGEVYRVMLSAINDYVTKPGDTYSVRTGEEFKLADTYCSEVIRENKTKYYADVENFTSLLKHPCYLSHQLRAYIGTPINLNGKRFGTLNYSSIHPREDAFSKSEIDFIESQAKSISNILHRQETPQGTSADAKKQRA